MILDYKDKRTREFAEGKRVPAFHSIAQQAEKRLEILDSATRIEDLMVLLSNRFKALGGNREGQFSIRINAQWRICFEWPEGVPGPSNVEITDYH